MKPILKVFLLHQGLSAVFSSVGWAGLMFLNWEKLGLGLMIMAAMFAAFGWIILLSFLARKSLRSQMRTPELLLAEWNYSARDWQIWVGLISKEFSTKSRQTALALVIAGLLASGLDFIPLSLAEGLGLGATLGIWSLLAGRIYPLLWKWAKTDDDRFIVVSRIGVDLGGVTHYWHKDGGTVERMSLDKPADSPFSVFHLTYVRTTFGRTTGLRRTSVDLALPVPVGQETVVKNWIDEFEKSSTQS